MHTTIMSVYARDSAPQLAEAMSSVLFAGVDSFLVGVDGPVGGRLAEVLRSFAADPRVQVIWFPQNRGLAHVLNDLISLCLTTATEFISRMDADDVVEPMRFKAQLQFLRSNPQVGVLGTWASQINELGNIVSVMRKPAEDGALKRRLSYDSPFIHPSVMFRASVFQDGRRYPTNTQRFEDVALWTELANSGIVFANLPECLLKYRFTQATARRRSGLKKIAQEMSIRFNYLTKAQPWRVHLYFVVLGIALVKLILPPQFLDYLIRLRSAATP